MESKDSVFILKGYAGTGKTTLIKGLIDALKVENKKFVLCAPTGRASKILRNKTGYGNTIHSTIYDFDNLITINSENEDFAEHSFQFSFPIIKLQENTIIIVDEASMISSKESKNELFNFGTNILLNDLLTFAQLHNSHNKMIIIGDPAQLPPVGDNNSWALEKSFFDDKKISIMAYTLETVLAEKFETIDKLAKTTLDELIDIDDIGSIIASCVVEYFSDSTNLELINKLKENPELKDILLGESK